MHFPLLVLAAFIACPALALPLPRPTEANSRLLSKAINDIQSQTPPPPPLSIPPSSVQSKNSVQVIKGSYTFNSRNENSDPERVLEEDDGIASSTQAAAGSSNEGPLIQVASNNHNFSAPVESRTPPVASSTPAAVTKQRRFNDPFAAIRQQQQPPQRKTVQTEQTLYPEKPRPKGSFGFFNHHAE